MAKRTQLKPPTGTSNALAVTPTDDEAVLLALNEAGIDASNDGMAECGASDFRTPSLLFNLKGRQDIHEQPVTQADWFDSVDKTARKRVRLALLEIHKSNSYSLFEQREQRNRRVCSSFDQRTGVMEDGTERPCKGCPDMQWRTQPDGKRRSNCSEVWNVFVYDLDTQKVAVVRFKRTSMDAIRSYVQQHHLGKRPLPQGGRGNIPLFAYEVTAHLEMDRSGNFAVPVLERGAVFPPDALRSLAETSQAVRDTLFERYSASEDTAEDTSFDTEAMGEPPTPGKFIQDAS